MIELNCQIARSREIGCYFYLGGVITLKEMKVVAALNDENKILCIEPLNKATGKTSETKVLIARLYTQAEIDRETAELMQEGCHVYKRVHSRIKQIR
jgi:hypothetical protein